METPFRMQRDTPNEINEDNNNNSDHTDGSTDLSSMTGDSEALIKAMRKEIDSLRAIKSTSYVINVKEVKPDKVKDASVLNDLTFIIGRLVFKRFKFLPTKNELFNYKKKGSIGNVVMSKKVLNIAEHKQEEWWCKYGKRTSAIITEKRSVVRTSLKKNFMSKLTFYHIYILI